MNYDVLCPTVEVALRTGCLRNLQRFKLSFRKKLKLGDLNMGYRIGK